MHGNGCDVDKDLLKVWERGTWQMCVHVKHCSYLRMYETTRTYFFRRLAHLWELLLIGDFQMCDDEPVKAVCF